MRGVTFNGNRQAELQEFPNHKRGPARDIGGVDCPRRGFQGHLIAEEDGAWIK